VLSLPTVPSRFLRIGLSVLAALLVGCRPASDTPATPEQPDGPRIVVLAPALAVILRDLGAADAVVGKHAWDMVLGPGVPPVGTHDDPDLEAILRVDPTHIVVQEMEARVPRSLRDMAEREGWVVWGFPLLTLDDIVETTDELALRLGVNGREGTPGPGARLAASWSDVGAAADGAGRVLLLANTDPPGAMGPGSFHHQLIASLGAEPALTDGGPWQELDHEDILRLAPDSILVFRPAGAERTGPAPTAEDAVAALGGIADLDVPAVRAGRVAIIDHPLGLLPASSLSEVAAEIARIFGGWHD
jgi:ABC-type Fe3+-hydroxamate transport system substrate-binding protein